MKAILTAENFTIIFSHNRVFIPAHLGQISDISLKVTATTKVYNFHSDAFTLESSGGMREGPDLILAAVDCKRILGVFLPTLLSSMLLWSCVRSCPAPCCSVVLEARCYVFIWSK